MQAFSPEAREREPRKATGPPRHPPVKGACGGGADGGGEGGASERRKEGGKGMRYMSLRAPTPTKSKEEAPTHVRHPNTLTQVLLTPAATDEDSHQKNRCPRHRLTPHGRANPTHLHLGSSGKTQKKQRMLTRGNHKSRP